MGFAALGRVDIKIQIQAAICYFGQRLGTYPQTFVSLFKEEAAEEAPSKACSKFLPNGRIAGQRCENGLYLARQVTGNRSRYLQPPRSGASDALTAPGRLPLGTFRNAEGWRCSKPVGNVGRIEIVAKET